MAHVLDLTGANERLFLLRQLVAGSRAYCKREGLSERDDELYGGEDWANYWGRLQFLVSKFILDAATSFRICQDTLRKRRSAAALSEIDATFGSSLGEVIVGGFALTLRESCNKIIHATDFALESATARTGNPPRRYNYWSGACHLKGVYGKRKWHVALVVYDWCDAVDSYFEWVAGELDWR